MLRLPLFCMKGITILLSFLMLSLSLKPCSDGVNEDHDSDYAIETNHDHSDDTDDSCPAICVCNCCGIAITYQAIQYFEILPFTKISTETKDDYTSLYAFDYLSSIWQPPRLIS